jgi:hypothetical protein
MAHQPSLHGRRAVHGEIVEHHVDVERRLDRLVDLAQKGDHLAGRHIERHEHIQRAMAYIAMGATPSTAKAAGISHDLAGSATRGKAQAQSSGSMRRRPRMPWSSRSIRSRRSRRCSAHNPLFRWTSDNPGGAKRLKELEIENTRLTKSLAESPCSAGAAPPLRLPAVHAEAGRHRQ